MSASAENAAEGLLWNSDCVCQLHHIILPHQRNAIFIISLESGFFILFLQGPYSCAPCCCHSP